MRLHDSSAIFIVGFVLFSFQTLTVALVPNVCEPIGTEASNATRSCANQEQDHIVERTKRLELILADDYKTLDPTLPNSIAEIKKRGGHRCWHKHNTFIDHLLGVHNILHLWGENEIAGRVGLLHSAYSNSYVNLALFDPNDAEEREVMKRLIGEEAEEIVHLFCIIDRQSIVVDTLLKNGVIPQDGLDVPHLRDEDVTVHLTAEILRLLLIFTIADISDQYFGWQDDLFGGAGINTGTEARWTNSMLLPGEDDLSQHHSQSLWPGPSRPGLWMSYASQLCKVVKTFQNTTSSATLDRNTIVPPIFDYCSEILTRENEMMAIDLYWEVINSGPISSEEVIEKLESAAALNPWFFESQVLLAQKYLHMNDNVKAKVATERALGLQRDWGTSYDKRMSFPAWVAWTRVLYARAVQNEGWPTNSWDVNNFGMVPP